MSRKSIKTPTPSLRDKNTVGSPQEHAFFCPKLLVLFPRVTPMFLVQSNALLGFNFLFRVSLDLDLGVSGHWEKVSMELSL